MLQGFEEVGVVDLHLGELYHFPRPPTRFPARSPLCPSVANPSSLCRKEAHRGAKGFLNRGTAKTPALTRFPLQSACALNYFNRRDKNGTRGPTLSLIFFQSPIPNPLPLRPPCAHLAANQMYWSRIVGTERHKARPSAILIYTTRKYPPRVSEPEGTLCGVFEHFRHVKGSSKERPWIVRVENVLKPSAASRCQGKAVEISLGLLPNPFRVRERGFRLFRGCKSHLAFCTSHSALLSCPLNLFSCLAPRALVYHAKGVTLPLRPPCGESIIAGQFGHCSF